MFAIEVAEFKIWHDRYQRSHGFQVEVNRGMAGDCASEVHIRLGRRLSKCGEAPVAVD